MIGAVNTEQLAAWGGDEREHWTTHAEHYDAAVRVYSRRLADASTWMYRTLR